MRTNFISDTSTQSFVGEFHGKELRLSITCSKDLPEDSTGFYGSDWELQDLEIDGVKLEAVTRNGESVERLHDKLIAIFEAEYELKADR